MVLVVDSVVALEAEASQVDGSYSKNLKQKKSDSTNQAAEVIYP